ncbi:MAG TPA: pyridoxal phosphate-dependent aminotransferase [Acidimicrobiales bacterium]|nr:pyridoxal phosphate-dependent aminotransferase [Acidimicrobiales bacterium]
MRARNPLAARLHGFGTTIFAEMSSLAAATDSVNLGQGFPDTDGPASLLEDAVAAIRSGQNQYPPGPGIVALRTAIAEHQRRFYDIDLDVDTEVLVTTGATEAIAAALLGMCEPGDEVVTFEPYYDSYVASIAMAGGTRRVVGLRAPDFALDLDALSAAITPKTRMLLLNTPHNPTGKVFTAEELDAVAALCIENDVLVVADEVYEHQTFGVPHVPVATREGMAERTLTISSAGKTFSVTGWKIGWVTGPADLVAATRTAKQFLTFVSGAPFQPAVAAALALGDDFYAGLATALEAKRDRLVAGLRDAGFVAFPPDGTYFVVVDASPLGGDDALAFCRALPHRAGVVGVPVSVFCDTEDVGRGLVRFAFCKRDDVLDEAVRRLGCLG